MARPIHIEMRGKKVVIGLLGNVLTQSTIKSQFLLPPDAIVSLCYEVDGQQIACEMNEAGTVFMLPDGWPTMQFFVESNKVPSRPAMPMDQSQDNVPTYVPIEVGEIGEIGQQIEKYLFYEEVDGIKNCFTAISTHLAVSFNHGPHQNWVSSPVENPTTVTICNQKGDQFQTKVIQCNPIVDFVVVRSEIPLVAKPPELEIPRKLERYILLGYPKPNSDYHALQGIFSSIERDSKCRIRGSSGSQSGYNGGPIFNYKGQLLGINVANESATKFTGFNGESTVNETVTEMNATFPSRSLIVLASNVKFNYPIEY